MVIGRAAYAGSVELEVGNAWAVSHRHDDRVTAPVALVFLSHSPAGVKRIEPPAAVVAKDHHGRAAEESAVAESFGTREIVRPGRVVVRGDRRKLACYADTPPGWRTAVCHALTGATPAKLSHHATTASRARTASTVGSRAIESCRMRAVIRSANR